MSLKNLVHRARMVDQPVHFALHELRRDPEPQLYRPRNAAVDVLLRHGTSDLDILDEVFSRGLYRVPPEVRAVLPPHPRVLDLGGQIGLFGAWAFSELEPDAGSPRSRPTPPTPRSAVGWPAPDRADRTAVARHTRGRHRRPPSRIGGDTASGPRRPRRRWPRPTS